ncbi:unnamed protein product [Clavelina lepadiformis]|uniref:TRUD domain-containing protein n=1 Tax=Clavelina lepadiformis TaxID=159417 RepID=A0ABP0G0U8_CLALP
MVYGKKPVVGDLIMLNAAHIEHPNDVSSSSAKRLKLCEDVTNVKKNDHYDQLQSNLKCLTEEDLASHSISDVILPLPGESITYPCNDVQKWYEEIIAEDGLHMSMLQHTVKEYRLSGAYRKLISHPTAVNWDIVRYDDYKKPLLLSDRDRLEGITELCLPQDGEYRAIRIHFNLPSSSYATVALRELLKSDMSVKNQSLIGDDHKLQSAGDRAD